VRSGGRILHEVATAVPALGFHPHLRMEGAVDTLVPDDVANQLVAATREALSNVARHAQATKVDVHMEVRVGEVVLEVIDDGVGIREGGRSSGLRNLRARAAAAGGWCATWPSKPDGTGTRLTFQAKIR
jgi:signal transduction histidine kinase